MPLPDGFNSFEHLQKTYRERLNKIIVREFNDLGDDTWVPDITTGRGALRVACTHLDTDNAAMTQMRSDLFFMVMRKGSDLHPAIFGLPATHFQETVEFLPQVTLFFREKAADAKAKDRYPIRAEVSYRVMDENLTLADARAIATKIRTQFATTNFYFDKGRTKFSYIDKAKGYQFILACPDEQDARKVIEQVLDLSNHSPEWERLTDTQSGRNFGAKRTKTILSKVTELPTQRPLGRVHFTHAELAIWGMTRNVILVDTTRRFKDALIYA
jgi:hypothetical protein